jgi:hypothetical protein
MQAEPMHNELSGIFAAGHHFVLAFSSVIMRSP